MLPEQGIPTDPHKHLKQRLAMGLRHTGDRELVREIARLDREVFHPEIYEDMKNEDGQE